MVGADLDFDTVIRNQIAQTDTLSYFMHKAMGVDSSEMDDFRLGGE